MTGGERIVDELVRLTSEVTGVMIAPDKGLLDSGLTSVELVSLLERAAATWQLEIPVEVLFERGDLTGLADYIATSRAATVQPSPSPAVTSTTPHQPSARQQLRQQIRQAVSESHD